MYMSCLRGGFSYQRHDQICALLTVVINEVTYKVSTEPALFPLTGKDLPRSANSSDEARVDIAARSFRHGREKGFFDVRVFNHYASTHRRQILNSSFNANEWEK